MEPRSLQEVARVAGGRLRAAADADAPVGPDVVIDSRLVTPGAVFVALPGLRVDGHDFVATAAAAGAGVAIVTRPVDADVPQIVVDDPLAAMAGLARAVVDDARSGGLRVVAVTGSSGKTSTKDLLAQVLGAAGPTVAPPGSFNNEIGAPLTACRVGAATRFLVAEMGARGEGHIAALTQVTPPDVGMVLNVGQAHVGEFGSVDGIARAKGELVEALSPQGWAVLNADDPRVIAMALRTSARVAAFSALHDPVETGAALRVWATDVVPDDLQRFSFTLNVARDDAATGTARVRLGVLGEHQVSNALAAATAAIAADLGVADVADALSSARSLSPWRMELVTREGGPAVLNDAYNANPDSMRAALLALRGLRRPGGRLVAALGDMLELGDSAAQAHRDVGALAAEVGVDELCAVGEWGGDLIEGFGAPGSRGRYFGSREDVVEHLRATLGQADVVLVKASRSSGLEVVADAVAAFVGGEDDSTWR